MNKSGAKFFVEWNGKVCDKKKHIEGTMVFNHLAKKPADRAGWRESTVARSSRPLPIIFALSLLSWAIFIVGGMGLLRLLGF